MLDLGLMSLHLHLCSSSFAYLLDSLFTRGDTSKCFLADTHNSKCLLKLVLDLKPSSTSSKSELHWFLLIT